MSNINGEVVVATTRTNKMMVRILIILELRSGTQEYVMYKVLVKETNDDTKSSPEGFLCVKWGNNSRCWVGVPHFDCPMNLSRPNEVPLPNSVSVMTGGFDSIDVPRQ
jgi:hypothetical protein